ncbi:MAG: hypothetical protein K6T77_03275 [candidate division WOR-3 bacterium]|nr:hypothetical protein [candidate division WOR-3 bacterium]MCR4424193.1 hypothetical protein [candidate division WOR-3 bacterium]MDH7519388.1 hypothetical protein [bacterium]
MAESSVKPLSGITVTVPFGIEPDWRFGTQPLPYTPEDAERFVSTVVHEIRSRSKTYRKLTFTTIYFGGCGPSCLTLDQLYRILQALYDHLVIQPEEQTLIVLPNTVDLARAKVLRESGFDQVTLRVNTDAQNCAENDFLILRGSDFFSVGFELPASIPKETLTRILALKPDHIIFYPAPVSPELAEKLNGEYNQFLPGHFALPEKENKHLLTLAGAKPVIGFGPGAITCTGKTRKQNPLNFSKYCKEV